MTTNADNHGEFSGLAVGWALHALEPDDEERFSAHVAECSECRAIVADVTTTLGEIVYAVPDAEPPAGLRERVLSAASEVPQDVGTPPVERVPRILSPAQSRTQVRVGQPPKWHAVWRHWQLWAIVVPLLAVLGLVAWNLALRHQRDASTDQTARYQRAITELTEVGSRRATLHTPSGKQLATVVVRDGHINVVAMAIPPNDPNKTTYVLWGLPSASAKPAALGTFDIVRDGVDVRAVKVTAQKLDFRTYAVSRESGRQAPGEPSSVMASGMPST